MKKIFRIVTDFVWFTKESWRYIVTKNFESKIEFFTTFFKAYKKWSTLQYGWSWGEIPYKIVDMAEYVEDAEYKQGNQRVNER